MALPRKNSCSGRQAVRRPYGGIRRAGRHSGGPFSPGFLLLDVLIAVIITVFVLLSSVALLLSASAAADAARQNTIAYNAARQVIENLREYRGAPLPADSSRIYTLEQFGPVPQLQQLASPTGSGVGATGELRIRPYRDTVKMVTVRIVWRAGDRGGKQRERVLTTLIAPEGVAR